MAMLDILKPNLKPLPLALGLGLALAVYGLIFVFLLANKNAFYKRMDPRLASEIVEIQKPNQPKPVSASEYVPGMVQTVDSSLKQNENALLPAPIQGLYENGKHGILPKISEQGITPFSAYKKPFLTTPKPIIAIAVMDFGLSKKNSDDVLKNLPPQVSLILSPYAENVDDWQKKARAGGYEIWLNLPINNKENDGSDAGPKGLSATSGGLKENEENLGWILSRTAGYAGIAAFIEPSFHVHDTLTKNVFGQIMTRGLGYFELNTNAGTTIETLSIAKKAPYIKNQFFLDETSLKALETTAQQVGYATGVVYPYPKNIASLKTWLDTLPGKGFAVAPLSAVTKTGS